MSWLFSALKGGFRPEGPAQVEFDLVRTAEELRKHFSAQATAVFEDVPQKWEEIRDQCRNERMWFLDHDALFKEAVTSTVRVSAEGVSVHAPARFMKTAHNIARILAAVAAIHGSYPRHTDVWILPSAMPRVFPEKGQAIDRKHINGGFCTETGGVARIVLLREDEILKVAVHELTHTHLETVRNPTSVHPCLLYTSPSPRDS